MHNNTAHIWKTLNALYFLKRVKHEENSKFSPCRLGCAAGAPLTLTFESDGGNSRLAGSLVVKLTRIQAGGTGLRTPVEARNFLFVSKSRRALGPTQPPVQRVWCSFPRLKRPGREAYHSPPPNVRIENEWGCTSTSI